jgi:hypothetical protein
LTDFVQIWRDLAHTSEHGNIDVIVTDYHQSVSDLWDTLMTLEMQLVEQLEVSSHSFWLKGDY